MKGKVTHFEIPIEDEERASKFYSEIFGWEINRWKDEDYWMIKTVETDEKNMPKEVGVINGAFYKKKENVGNLIVITVEDLDKTIEMIKEQGGGLVSEKREVEDMGYYARIKDSEGNNIGIWEDKKK